MKSYWTEMLTIYSPQPLPDLICLLILDIQNLMLFFVFQLLQLSGLHVLHNLTDLVSGFQSELVQNKTIGVWVTIRQWPLLDLCVDQLHFKEIIDAVTSDNLNIQMWCSEIICVQPATMAADDSMCSWCFLPYAMGEMT